MIELKNVCFSYEKTEVLKNINLKITEGEFIGLLGANGSGKTTFVKLLNALIIPDSGEVIVDNKLTSDNNELWNIRQKVGMVFQNPDNQIVATIVENDVAFVLENLGVPSDEIKERVKNSLEIVELSQKRKSAPHNLSGGEKQRLALASIIAMRPKYIVFDEPTSMLDPKGRVDVLKIITKLRKEHNISVIMISHHMEEVIDCDRIIIMKEGKIVCDNKPSKILTDTKLLNKLYLEPPPFNKIANKIKKIDRGFNSNILTIDEMVENLCIRYKPKN